VERLSVLKAMFMVEVDVAMLDMPVMVGVDVELDIVVVLVPMFMFMDIVDAGFDSLANGESSFVGCGRED
jgi:hypothetical protein